MPPFAMEGLARKIPSALSVHPVSMVVRHLIVALLGMLVRALRLRSVQQRKSGPGVLLGNVSAATRGKGTRA